MYYDIGIVLYSPSIRRKITDPYEVGDIIPIICAFSTFNNRHIYWFENDIVGLRVGDPIAFNVTKNEMFRIEVIEGLGVRARGLDF